MSGELIVALLALVVAVVGALFAGLQSLSARRSADAAKIQADRAGEQVDVARQSADASQKQVEAARRQNELQEKMQRDQAQPYVVADVRPSPGDGHLLQVVVENHGSTSATCVQVSFSPALQMHLGSENGPFTGLDQGISFLAPGRRMTWHLGNAPDYYSGDEPPPDTLVVVNCNGPFGPLEPLEYTISMAAMRNQEATAHGTLTKVARAVDKLTKAVERR